MRTSAVYSGGGLTVSLYGELDHHGAKKCMAEIERLIDAYLPKMCVLDMKGLGFMDSSGIAVVLKTLRRMDEIGGGVAVVNVKEQPMRVLDAAGIGRLVRVNAAKE